MTSERRPVRRLGLLSWAGGVVSWMVILGVLSIVTIAVLIPRLGGATPYTVLTGSMRPAMPPGTLVVVRPVPPRDIRPGTAITYQLESGKPTVVTHRVVSAGTSLTGERAFSTRGDANNTIDAQPVRPVQIKGAVWYSVPYLGYVSTLLTGQQRHRATLVVASLLFVYAAVMAVLGARQQVRTRRAATGARPSRPPVLRAIRVRIRPTDIQMRRGN